MSYNLIISRHYATECTGDKIFQLLSIKLILKNNSENEQKYKFCI